MKRAAIYSRFSSDLQNPKSCKDQEAVCAKWAEQHDMEIVEIFSDEAQSGASIHGRLGLADLMHSAYLKRFDVIICEDLDRISRNLAELASIYDILTFHEISLFTLSDGKVNDLQVAFKGTLGQAELKKLSQKTRRGLRAVIKDCRSAGGKSYGYEPTPGAAGIMTINQFEADIVRRIFEQYISGETPRRIAKGLNDDKIPSPRGGKWNASTIHGSKERQNGILRNSLYRGEIVWNRQRFLKDPSTGKRVSRSNPEADWERADVPHLQIIDIETWQLAADILSTKSQGHAEHHKKPQHLLSGLIKCGSCGASYTVIGRDRLGYAGHRERGDCPNNRTLTRKHVEERVLAGLQEQLSQADVIAEYLRAYEEERVRLQAQERSILSSKETLLAKLDQQIERAVNAILNGNSSKTLEKRMSELEEEKNDLEQQIASLQDEIIPLSMEQNSAQTYLHIITNLSKHINDMPEDKEREQIFAEIRQLIDNVVIFPKGEREPVVIEVHGLLAALLGNSTPHSKECRGALVAGAGFEPATFRL